MKKILFGMMACAALCACTSDDLLSVANQSGNVSGDGVATYMTVRIKDVNSGTRATAGDFAYGTTQEQTVNNAYFYFYNEDGEYMAKGSLGTVTGEGKSVTSDVENVEWNSETVVAVWGLAGDNLPTKMLTVLNQPSGVDLTNKDFDAAVATLAGTPWGDTTNGFVMSTSVYEDGSNNTLYNYTALTEDNFAPEPVNLEEHYGEDGAYTAVDVYVERLAAKVGLGVDNSILWVNANQGGKLNVAVTELMLEDFAVVPEAPTGNTYVIQLLGWDVDGVARDAYVVKKIENWTGESTPFTDWNSVTDHRSYWAESEAYGDGDVTYPKSNWKANTAEEEDTDPLNKYLRYVDLQEPVALGSTTYCGENTNSATVIALENDSNMNCLTQVLMKAQFGYEDNNVGTFTGVDLVKYHGEYLTLADFEEDMIAEVERYDFSGMIDDVIAALEERIEGNQIVGSMLSDYDLSSLFAELASDIEPVIYCKENDEEGNPVSDAEYIAFDSRFLQLYSQNDGRVSIWFDTATSVDTENNSHYNHSDDYQSERPIPAWYTQTNLVKKASESMDDYTFYVHVEAEGTLETVLKLLGGFSFITVEDDVEGTGQYIALDSKITIAVNGGSSDGGYDYDARNFFIRVIEREAAGIVDDWSTTGFPYFYNGGLMYYNVPIEHLASKATENGSVYPDASGVVEGQYGVVRNHWYDITVTSVENFGHAIADEKEVIVPQVEEDYYYLGADINILSWKMVEQTVGW